MSRASHFVAFVLALVICLAGPMPASAQSGGSAPVMEKACQKDWELIEQMTRTCWDCFFPFTIIGIPIGGKTSNLPDDRNKSPICICPGRTGYPSFGFSLGWWQPDHTIEMVRQPWCMPSLGGFVLTDDNKNNSGLPTPGRWGGPQTYSNDSPGEFYMNFHWYMFPIGYLLSWLSDYVCSKKSSTAIDIAFMSELDPSWNNDSLALWVGPEAKIFSQPWAVVACGADAVMASVSRPMKSLYYCSGSWGLNYPMSGMVANETGLTVNSSLTAARGLSKMHRFGIATRNYGTSSICANTRRFILEKQQYRFQMVFPLTEAGNGKMSRNKGGGNHWIGATTFRWGG